MKKYISLIFSCLMLLMLVSCAENPVFDIKGTWTSDVKLKSEMTSKDDPFVTVAYIYTSQKNEFIFNEDGTYSRSVVQNTDKVESLVDEYDEKELFDLYSKSNSSVVLKGEYSLKGKKLSLKTVTISFGEEEIPYSEYYRDVPALGPVEVKIPVELDSENKLNIQGIKFSKIDLDL